MRTATTSAKRETSPANCCSVYSTTHGHTEKIAQRIADALVGQGVDVDMRRRPWRRFGQEFAQLLRSA